MDPLAAPYQFALQPAFLAAPASPLATEEMSCTAREHPPDSSLSSPASAMRAGALHRPWMRPRTAAAPALPYADGHGLAARVGARHGRRAWMRSRTAAAPELKPHDAAACLSSPPVPPARVASRADGEAPRASELLLASPRDRCWTRGSRQLRASRGAPEQLAFELTATCAPEGAAT
ncbi:hypothetical protein ACQJBY_032772 [Aegilops geniculata]